MASLIEQIQTLQLKSHEIEQLSQWCQTIDANKFSPEQAWQFLSQNLLSHQYSFNIQLAIFKILFSNWPQDPDSAPAYIPSDDVFKNANLAKLMHKLGYTHVKDFHDWSVQHYQDFWQTMIQQLNINLKQKPSSICDLSKGITSPRWLPQAELNIVDSCFNASPNSTAIIYQDEQKIIHQLSFAQLNQLVNAIAYSLTQQGYQQGDYIAIVMPMNTFAVAAYLGIIKMGGVVVSIADSFSPEEMNARFKITATKAVFTQDNVIRGDKAYSLYDKVCKTIVPQIIVIPSTLSPETPFNNLAATTQLRQHDLHWHDFLKMTPEFNSIPCQPMDACNILFSSGTTSEPKAIVWNHTTPIKAASDAYLHQNIQAGDILTWPTNLGWMMGPWLIYAAFINRASLALYTDNPKEKAFGDFIARAKVTMLGVVPTMIAAWRQSKCMESLDWSSIKVASSTGECSNPEDMFYLMYLINYHPIIEYCGGTEIGGAYVSSTVIEKNYPAVFTTPTMGLNFEILSESGAPTNEGEVALISPSIGLSTKLLNADHQHVYFDKMPITSDGKQLRCHGDQIKRYPSGHFSVEGRVDDTMNLGGIKVSSAEIERVLTGTDGIIEVAAIAVAPPNNGPSHLVIFAVTTDKLEKKLMIKAMQQRINERLNPLFRISDIVFVEELPKTASNKIMRRTLRKKYVAD